MLYASFGILHGNVNITRLFIIYCFLNHENTSSDDGLKVFRSQGVSVFVI